MTGEEGHAALLEPNGDFPQGILSAVVAAGDLAELDLAHAGGP
jgi:hypothetical protein